MTVQITAERFHAAGGVEDWRCLYHLVPACFRTGSLPAGVAFIDEIGRLAGRDEQEHLNIDLRPSPCRCPDATSHWLDGCRRRLGIPADPTAVQVLNITLDAQISAEVLPFRRALLGYRRIGDDYLADPARRGPGFGLQPMGQPRPQRSRMHVDIAVPHDQAANRVAAAPAAGGRMVTEAHAPSWWVLADAEGNEACIATWAGRE